MAGIKLTEQVRPHRRSYRVRAADLRHASDKELRGASAEWLKPNSFSQTQPLNGFGQELLERVLREDDAATRISYVTLRAESFHALGDDFVRCTDRSGEHLVVKRRYPHVSVSLRRA
jgi:hypothetical protein